MVPLLKNVWLGTELFQLPKQWCLWFMSQSDWYYIITYLNVFWWNSYLRKCVFFLTHCAGFFKSPHFRAWWENTDKTMTTFLELWDESMSRIFPLIRFHIARLENFEALLGDCRASAEVVSVFRKVWLSHIIPNPLSQLLSVFHFIQFFCLGCNPVIGLWQCISVKAFFFYSSSVLIDKIKPECWKMLLFKSKIQYLRLPCGSHRPNTVLPLFNSSCCAFKYLQKAITFFDGFWVPFMMFAVYHLP